jgi:hypothetical protein
MCVCVLFCNVEVGVFVGFIMHECVFVWGFVMCGWVFVWGFVMCGVF